MNREYHKWHSPALGRDMELLVFGHGGMPLLVFPTSTGRFFDYENHGMIAALAHKYDGGQLQAFCVDSVDAESWSNRQVPPRNRVERHMQYERYILMELLPLVRQRTGADRIAVTGCSFGGYHAVNFALRHPDVVHTCVSMGGSFDVRGFLDGYWDQDVYFHNPVEYLRNLTDEWYLSLYREGFRLVLVTGEHDICLDDNFKFSSILNKKGIPHHLDVWGDGTGHDWPWWQRMARKFF
ncbi:MAG: esterase family protein [Bryobacterales bacterium]|nr:esterase family protein [Bryobacterales bacterium]